MKAMAAQAIKLMGITPTASLTEDYTENA